MRTAKERTQDRIIERCSEDFYVDMKGCIVLASELKESNLNATTETGIILLKTKCISSDCILSVSAWLQHRESKLIKTD